MKYLTAIFSFLFLYSLSSFAQEYLPAPANNRAEQIIRRTAYTMSYNKDWTNCNWVYWRLTREHCYGKIKRNDQKFLPDEAVKGNKAQHEDYIQSGYDRGHMCPAGDNKWSKTAMNETFKLSNICPQRHNLNVGDWNDLEQACRYWAKSYGELLIVCGPVYYNNKVTKWLKKRKVGVPDAFFKCIVRLGKHPAGLAFLYENNGKHHEMNYYVKSIDNIERLTGLNFFSGIPNERQIESYSDLSQWKTPVLDSRN